MASEVVSVALETVRDLLIEEAKFVSGVSDQVKEVEAELIRMQCFLKDADRRQHKDETIRNFAREIRHLAYRIENVLETYAIKVQSRREGRGFQNALKRFACIFTEGKTLHNVGLEIANIKKNLKDITTSLHSYGVKEISTASEDGQSSNPMVDQNQKRLRQTYPHQVEEYFVGMKDDIRELVGLICDEGIRCHRIISIHGMGGLGKTTLAKKIYNNTEVQHCFKAFAWVSITQQFGMRAVLGDILKQLLSDQRKESVEKMEEMEEREMVNELYKVQKEMKCFVVLDDVWEIDDWKCLSAAFPFAEANSKILMTTRNKKLAEDQFPYSLKFLNEDEGWELLQKRAFAKNAIAKEFENEPKLEEIGREMVHKCGYLPLAISVLGGILSQKSSLQDWKSVNKYVDSYLRMSESSKGGYGTVLQVLALSYDELPYHLKPCFLHLGHFREDKDINVEMLYLMWIAEGMISSNHRGTEETLTDVAERYLFEMASRSMVQLKLDEFSTTRRIGTCRLHDLMRDFCLAHGKEVDFIKVMNFVRGKDPLSDSYVDQFSPSRCSIHIDESRRDQPAEDNDAMTNMALETNRELRSLLIISEPYFIKASFPQVICDSHKFKSLRVLKLQGYDFQGKRLPKGIKKLIHLRFLSLRYCRMDKLPSSIGKLQYLQTLDIRVIGSIGVPNVLWKLDRLRHLYLNRSHRKKLCFCSLIKLETLVGFDNETDDLRDLSKLNNLRRWEATVFVRGDSVLPDFFNYLNSNQHKLREVQLNVEFYSVLVGSKFEERIVPLEDFFACLHLHHLRLESGRCEFHKLAPPGLHVPSNLIELKLERCKVEGDPMNFLGKLSNLRRLRLYFVNLLDRKIMICDANSFPELISLEISRLSKLENWVVDQGAMPKLSNLEIRYCDNLEMIPDGLRFIDTLKELKIDMPDKFKRRIQGAYGLPGVDFDKIRHVPFISVV